MANKRVYWDLTLGDWVCVILVLVCAITLIVLGGGDWTTD